MMYDVGCRMYDVGFESEIDLEINLFFTFGFLTFPFHIFTFKKKLWRQLKNELPEASIAKEKNFH